MCRTDDLSAHIRKRAGIAQAVFNESPAKGLPKSGRRFPVENYLPACIVFVYAFTTSGGLKPISIRLYIIFQYRKEKRKEYLKTPSSFST
jgi:hypothetical protein